MFSFSRKLFLMSVFLFGLIKCGEISMLNLDKVCQTGLREDNTNYIYCARQNLSKIPSFFTGQSSNIVYDEFVLSDNQIERIDHNSINIKVRKLYLDQNPLRFCHKQAFDHVKNYLEELYLEQKREATLLDSDYSTDLVDLKSDDWFLFDQAVFQKCANLKLLSVKNYKFNKLKPNAFLKMIKLEILTISNSQMIEIDDLAFNGLEQTLLDLNLDSNFLELVPTVSLQRLKKLKKLSLSQNRIKTLHSNAFFYFKSLQSLDLSYNYLKRLEENSFNGPIQNSLKFLNLQNNELKWSNFIQILYNLNSLQELNLDFNKLGLNQMKKNKTSENLFLSPSQNSLIHLNLNYLSMQGNQMTDENLNMFMQEYDYEALSSRQSDDASDYLKWPDNLNESRTFKKSPLKLKSNLKQFKFTNLVKLNLARNKLSKIPTGFFQYLNTVQLKQLILEKNQMQNKFNSNLFAGLELTLTSLNLNNLGAAFWSSSSVEALFKLNALENLKLNGNGLSHKSFGLFEKKNEQILPRLSALEMQNNNFHQLPNFLCQLNNLTDLDLSLNNLDHFDLKCFAKLKQLNLNNNPLTCDCKLKELKLWLVGNYDKDLLDLIQWECAQPPRLKAQFFTNVNLEDLYCLNEKETTINQQSELSLLTQIKTDPTKTTTTTTISTTNTKPITTTTLKNSKDLLVKKFLIDGHQKETTTNQKLLSNLDIGYFSLIVGISFGISAICLIILAIFYLCFIRRQEKLAKHGMLQLFNTMSNKYENRRICSPASTTTTTSTSTTAASIHSKRTQTPELKEIFDESFSRNNSITNSSEVLFKIQSMPMSRHQNDCGANGQHFYHSLGERAKCKCCENFDNGYFQINEGFNTIANYNKTFLNDFNRIENSFTTKTNSSNNKSAMIFSIDEKNVHAANNENHIYHEINTPVKSNASLIFTPQQQQQLHNDFFIFPVNNNLFVNNSTSFSQKNNFLNNCGNSLIV